MNSIIFIWIPETGCKNREDEDGTIPTAHPDKQPILHRLFKSKTARGLWETQFPLGILILTGPHR